MHFEEDILGNARTFLAVDILTVTHKGAARGDADSLFGFPSREWDTS